MTRFVQKANRTDGVASRYITATIAYSARFEVSPNMRASIRPKSLVMAFTYKYTSARPRVYPSLYLSSGLVSTCRSLSLRQSTASPSSYFSILSPLFVTTEDEEASRIPLDLHHGLSSETCLMFQCSLPGYLTRICPRNMVRLTSLGVSLNIV